jgi:DNA invertase Pin-like site-specific DNA recombinase
LSSFYRKTALNVFHGMRRAKKEGGWMGTPPVGYLNKTDENGRKLIMPKDTDGLFAKMGISRIGTW